MVYVIRIDEKLKKTIVLIWTLIVLAMAMMLQTQNAIFSNNSVKDKATFTPSSSSKDAQINKAVVTQTNTNQALFVGCNGFF